MSPTVCIPAEAQLRLICGAFQNTVLLCVAMGTMKCSVSCVGGRKHHVSSVAGSSKEAAV